MKMNEINKILELHKKWLNREPDGIRAHFINKDLRGIYFVGADLRRAYLVGSDLRGSALKMVDFRGANLYGANLRGADLQGSNLEGANLRYADLTDANLEEVNIEMVDLSKTYGTHLACPEKDSFIGFKKAIVNEVNGDKKAVIVELKILEDSKRSSATSRKCRCEKAKVLSITSIKGEENYDEAVSKKDHSFKYKVGEIVQVDNFDDNRFNECAPGIHFFITRQEAVDY